MGPVTAIKLWINLWIRTVRDDNIAEQREEIAGSGELVSSI
jgi:hypothetical protein